MLKNDTRGRKRISAHTSTRYAGADEDEDVADDASDSSASMLQHPRLNSFRRARDARKPIGNRQRACAGKRR